MASAFIQASALTGLEMNFRKEAKHGAVTIFGLCEHHGQDRSLRFFSFFFIFFLFFFIFLELRMGT